MHTTRMCRSTRTDSPRARHDVVEPQRAENAEGAEASHEAEVVQDVPRVQGVPVIHGIFTEKHPRQNSKGSNSSSSSNDNNNNSNNDNDNDNDNDNNNNSNNNNNNHHKKLENQKRYSDCLLLAAASAAKLQRTQNAETHPAITTLATETSTTRKSTQSHGLRACERLRARACACVCVYTPASKQPRE